MNFIIMLKVEINNFIYNNFSDHPIPIKSQTKHPASSAISQGREGKESANLTELESKKCKPDWCVVSPPSPP